MWVCCCCVVGWLQLPPVGAWTTPRQQWDTSIHGRPSLVSITLLRDAAPNSPGSEVDPTSKKVREMAAFLSVAMTQSMLARQLQQSEPTRNDSAARSNNDADQSDTILTDLMDLETAPMQQQETKPPPVVPAESWSSMHRKEGDRVIATKDAFSADLADSSGRDNSAETIAVTVNHDVKNETALSATDAIATKIATESLGGLDATLLTTNVSTAVGAKHDQQLSVSAVQQTSDLTIDSLITTKTAEMSSNGVAVPLVPSVISTAFGRPLPVSREGVPPLQPDQDRQNGVAKAAASFAPMVTDSDPYGE
jgi:hypothetical protein